MNPKTDKGDNSKTVFSMLGASNHSKETRAYNDWYATPPDCVEKLLEKEQFNHYVLEPCVGQGHIAEVLKLYGHDVTAMDIIDRDYEGTIVQDFLTTTKTDFPMSPDIITNPPYSIATEFVQHCLDISMDGTKIAMLLKIQFLESQIRWEIFKNNPPIRIYTFVNRVNCWKNGVKPKTSSAVFYAWFIWEKGYIGKPTIDWIV